MRSKTSFFNFALFKNNTARFWPIWAGYLTILIFAIPINIFMNYAGTNGDILAVVYDAYADVTVLAAFFSIIAAMGLFNYMYSPKIAGTVGSFPITRRSMFFTCYLTGVIWFAGTNAIVALLTMLAELALGKLMMSYILQWLVISTLSGIFFMSIASFCAIMTGNVLVLPVMYAFVNFIAAAAETVFEIIFSELIFGYIPTDRLETELFTPIIHLAEMDIVRLNSLGERVYDIGETTNLIYEGWGYLITLVIIGLVLVAVALLLVKNRPAETTSDVLSFTWLRPIFRYIAAFGIGVTVGGFVHMMFFASLYSTGTQYIGMAICMAIFGLIGGIAAEMLIRKSLRAFDKLRDPIIAAVLIAVLITCIGLDAFGIETKIADSPDVVKGRLSIDGEEIDVPFEELDTLREIHKGILAYRKEIIEGQDELRDTEKYFKNVSIYYYNKDGAVLNRTYSIPVFTDKSGNPIESYDFAGLIEEYVNREEVIKRRFAPDGYFCEYIWMSYDKYNEGMSYSQSELVGTEADDFYKNVIIPDIEDGLFGIIDFYKYMYSEDAIIISGEIHSVGAKENYISFNYDLTEETPRMTEFFKNRNTSEEAA